MISICRTASSSGSLHTLHFLSSLPLDVPPFLCLPHAQIWCRPSPSPAAVMLGIVWWGTKNNSSQKKTSVARASASAFIWLRFFLLSQTFSALLFSVLCGHGSRNTCICSAVSAVWEEEFWFQCNSVYVTTAERKESDFCSRSCKNFTRKNKLGLCR